NSNIEIRNKHEIRNFKPAFEFGTFGFASDFDIRVSDLRGGADLHQHLMVDQACGRRAVLEPNPHLDHASIHVRGRIDVDDAVLADHGADLNHRAGQLLLQGAAGDVCLVPYL